MFRSILAAALCVGMSYAASAQKINRLINAKEVKRIETVLSADDMAGRKPFTPGIDKAADFISAEFKKAGVQPVNGSYFQEFKLPQINSIITGSINGMPVDPSRIAVITAKNTLSVNSSQSFETIIVRAGDTLQNIMGNFPAGDRMYLLVIDTAHKRLFNRLRQPQRINPSMKNTMVLVLGNTPPSSFDINLKRETVMRINCCKCWRASLSDSSSI